MAAGDGRTQDAKGAALGCSGGDGHGGEAGMERRLVVVVGVALAGKEQTPYSGCRAAWRRAMAASLGMATAVRIVGGMLLGVVALARMPMP